MALNLYLSFRGAVVTTTYTLDGTHDHTAGDTTGTLTSAAAVNSDAALYGAAGLDCPTAGDAMQFAVSSEDIFESSVGGFALGFRLQSFATTRPLVRAINTATPNNNISLELVGTDDATGRELLLRNRLNGGVNAALSTTAADMALGTKYFAVCRYDEPNNDRKLQLFNGDTGALITEVEDLATGFDVPSAIDLLNIGESSGGALDVHIDNFFTFDDYNEPVEDYFDIDSYPDYGVPAADPPEITDVNGDDEIVDGQPIVITGLNFEAAQVGGQVFLVDQDTLLEVELTASAWADHEITATAIRGTAPGVRFGSTFVYVVTDGALESDPHACEFFPAAGSAYIDLGASLAAGTDVDAYAEAQTYASGVALTLEAGAAAISPPRRPIFTADSDESATLFTIVGELLGNPQNEVVAGPNNGTTFATLFYDVIDSITPNATEGTDEIEVGADTLRYEGSPDIVALGQILVSAILGAGFDETDVFNNADGSYSWTFGVEGWTFEHHNIADGWGDPDDITILVDQPPVITTAALPDATIGVPYFAVIEATGEGPFTYAADGLPSWAEFDEGSGAISGTPDAIATTADIEFIVSNAHGDSDPVELDLEVLLAAPVITTTTLPRGFIGHPYSQQIVHTGSPATFAVTVGTLPDGLTLSAAGLISGTPTTEETQAFTVEATNDADSDTQALSIEIDVAGVSTTQKLHLGFGLGF